MSQVEVEDLVLRPEMLPLTNYKKTLVLILILNLMNPFCVWLTKARMATFWTKHQRLHIDRNLS